MFALYIAGAIITGVSCILHLGTYRAEELKASLSLLMVVCAVLFPFSVWIIFGSIVNPLASIWGAHSITNISLAAFLLAAFIPGLLLTIRLSGPIVHSIRRSISRNPEMVISSRILRQIFRLLGGLKALRYILMGFFITNSAYLVYSFASTPHPPSIDQLAVLSARPGFEWVLIHPTPAIHHTYASASLFAVYMLSLLVLVCSVPASSALVRWIGKPLITRRISALANAVGIILLILGGLLSPSGS